VERKSRIKDYRSQGERNLKNGNSKIISLGSKGWTKDPKKGRYLNGLYNRNSGVKTELI